MTSKTLDIWLQEIESNHPVGIDMGLDRSRDVYHNLNINFDDQVVITVGGTNGKGTTCCFIEQVCLDAGLSVGVFSSPHILSFCERIRLNGNNIAEDSLCDIFAHIDASKKGVTLTYFEYATLAALEAFNRHKPDIILLEVGLGGRLDAVNIVDPNIAVITSIGLDHQDWLGDTKELIGFEKAGIFRPDIPIIIGEANCPKSMLDHAHALSVSPILRDLDFEFCEASQTATFKGQSFDLSQAKIPMQNIATGLACLEQLALLLQGHKNISTSVARFVLPDNKIQTAIASTSLAGRLQQIQSHTQGQSPLIVADVAHNEDSAKQLRKMIERELTGKCHIVVGMLKDKNIEVSLQAFDGLNVCWYCASLPSERGEKAQRLIKAASGLSAISNDVATKNGFECVEDAFALAKQNAKPNDTILVMGSFLTVSAVMSLSSVA